MALKWHTKQDMHWICQWEIKKIVQCTIHRYKNIRQLSKFLGHVTNFNNHFLDFYDFNLTTVLHLQPETSKETHTQPSRIGNEREKEKAVGS